MISIGVMARSFHVLPSQVAQAATSFDLMIMDVMTTWDKFKENPGQQGLVSQENLEQILKRNR